MRRVLRIGVPSALEGFLRAGSGVAFLGISVAATSLVGQRLGAGDPAGASRAGWTAAGVGVALLVVLGAVLYIAARPVASLFSNQPQTVALAVRYLRILALAQPVFLLAVVMAGALRGGGDTRFPMWVSLFSGWVFLLPTAYGLAVLLGLGPAAAWTAQAVNYAISAVLVTLRFRSGRWRTMTV